MAKYRVTFESCSVLRSVKVNAKTEKAAREAAVKCAKEQLIKQGITPEPYLLLIESCMLDNAYDKAAQGW